MKKLSLIREAGRAESNHPKDKKLLGPKMAKNYLDIDGVLDLLKYYFCWDLVKIRLLLNYEIIISKLWGFDQQNQFACEHIIETLIILENNW